MGLFGSTMGFAFAEIKEKSEMLLSNVILFVDAKYIKEGDDACIYIEDFIKVEIQHGLKMLNGGNGKKHLKKGDDIWKFSYMSSSYVYLRQAWLMDYMVCNLKYLREMKNDYLSKTMQVAYENSLS